MRYLLIALLFFSCATAQVGERTWYCDWDGAPQWMVSDMKASGWGLLDGIYFKEEGTEFWALLFDNPEDGLDGCDYWALMKVDGYDDSDTPLITVVTVGECEDWEQLKSNTKSAD